MNTPNLDKLMEQAANADRRSYEGARIRTRFACLFATHGPAVEHDGDFDDPKRIEEEAKRYGLETVVKLKLHTAHAARMVRID